MTYLYVGATAETDRGALAAAAERVSAQFGLPVREMELPRLDFAFDPRRNQYGSAPVLEMLSRLCPPDAARLVGFTEHDLFIPVLTFVFGHAQLGGRVAWPGCGRNSTDSHPIGKCFSTACARRPCMRLAIPSDWCTARTPDAPCRFPRASSRSMKSGPLSARRACGSCPRG